MNRIAYIVFRMFGKTVKYLCDITKLSKDKYKDCEKMHQITKQGCYDVMKYGNIRMDVKGVENIPEKDGFVFYPNHQGMFDVLMFFASSPKAFAFVIKKEMQNVILVKQIIRATDSLCMDRKDLRQSVEIINTMTENIKKGKNYLIFAEGTRSKEGNKLLNFKGGSFKAAINAKCPIVPCALVDSYKVFDEKGTKMVDVSLQYLKPIVYEEYKDMKSAEIANLVKGRIEEAIASYEKERNK